LTSHLIKHRAMNDVCRSRSIDPYIYNISTCEGWVVSFTSWLSDGRLVGSAARQPWI